MGLFPLLPPMARHSLCIDSSDIDDLYQRSQDYMDMDLNNIHKDFMVKEAIRSYNKFNQTRHNEVEAWKGRIHYDGEKLVVGEPQQLQRKASPKGYLANDERVYVFISESVPLATLINYADTMDRLKDPNVFFVMRGCVGGCSKIKPTIAFVQSILTIDEKKRRVAEVQVDPFLFRSYEIKQVPAIVYARGVKTVNSELSEGLSKNLKGKPTAAILYGDVSLPYALEQINTRVKSDSLTVMAKVLNTSYYEQ
jgi:type-F conjugative transfer system pilin assembly protein TrbC